MEAVTADGRLQERRVRKASYFSEADNQGPGDLRPACNRQKSSYWSSGSEAQVNNFAASGCYG